MALPLMLTVADSCFLTVAASREEVPVAEDLFDLDSTELDEPVVEPETEFTDIMTLLLAGYVVRQGLQFALNFRGHQPARMATKITYRLSTNS